MGSSSTFEPVDRSAKGRPGCTEPPLRIINTFIPPRVRLMWAYLLQCPQNKTRPPPPTTVHPRPVFSCLCMCMRGTAHGNAGSSPVTRGILASTLAASAVLHIRDPDGILNVTLGEIRWKTPHPVFTHIMFNILCCLVPLTACSAK